MISRVRSVNNVVGLLNEKCPNEMMDKNIIRDLAKKAAEIAILPEQKEKVEIWMRHNRLEHIKPMVLIFPEGSWRELITDKDILTTDPFYRAVEYDLRKRLYYWEHLQDDNVIDGTIVSPLIIHTTGWGVDTNTTNPQDPYGAKHYNPVIQTEVDIEKLHKPKITIDWKATKQHYEKLCDLVGGILPVQRQGPTHFGFAIMDQFAQWRGLDQIFLDMIDRPKWLHRALNFMTECMLEQLDFYEKENVLSLNNGAHYCGSGGVGFTDQLPQSDFDGVHVRAIDMWGFATTQIFSEVSPAMHEEFALQYEKRWLERFGLNAYGCCEPLHKKLHLVKTIPRIRRISISSWANVQEATAQLGDRYIFSWKPNPAVIAAEQWNPDLVRCIIQDMLQKTRGCIVEIIMKDTHTCRNQAQRMWEWVKIAKEVARNFF